MSSTPNDCFAELTVFEGSFEGVGTGTIDATVPAGQDFMVMIQPRQPAPPHGAVPHTVEGVLRITGLSNPQSLEWTSWVELKALYR